MRVVSISQNSQDWVEWRGKGLGASDAPVVMGVSPWTTPFELWLNKTGVLPPPQANHFAARAMQRGHDLEPKARAIFEKAAGAAYPAISLEHSEYSFIRASLDGFNAERNELLEIKCPGKADHATAKNGTVPKKYFPQLQQQFLVSGAASGVYFSWDGVSEEGFAIKVYPDHTYITNLLEALQAFWSRVQTQIAPPSTVKDLKGLTERVSAAMINLNQLTNALALVSDNLE